jgi:hypothetical protein
VIRGERNLGNALWIGVLPVSVWILERGEFHENAFTSRSYYDSFMALRDGIYR